MPLHLFTTSGKYELDTSRGHSIRDVLNAHGIPLTAVVTVNSAQEPVSVSCLAEAGDFMSYLVRNISILPGANSHPSVLRESACIPVAYQDDPADQPQLFQLDHSQCREWIQREIFDVLMRIRDRDGKGRWLVAFSPGGDGRLLAEFVKDFADSHGGTFDFKTFSLGFEDELSLARAAKEQSDRFRLNAEFWTRAECQAFLGIDRDFSEALPGNTTHSRVEDEVWLTYWLQTLCQKIRGASGYRGIIFGYNLEDCLAEAAPTA